MIKRLWRALRSHPSLGRIHREWARRRAVAVLKPGQRADGVAVPFDFVSLCPEATPHHAVFLLPGPERFDAVIVDSERLADVDPRLLTQVRTSFQCSWMDAPFAVFVRGTPQIDRVVGPHPSDLLARMAALESSSQRGYTPHRPKPPGPPQGGSTTAVAVTTFERPAALARALPQIASLGAPIVVVDDGSRAGVAEANRSLCERHAASYLLLPTNRGLPAAMNVALDYWLADPAVEWISYFQDDVDVRPDVLEIMSRLQHAERAPLLTGFDAADHPTVSTVENGGVLVKEKRTTPAVHLHAHRAYWASIMPIPSPYLGAPKPRIGASLEDWWITCHSPASVEKRGLLVPCVPGLVATFLSHRDDSTWDNPAT